MFTGPFWDHIASGADYQTVENELLELTREFGVEAVSCFEITAPTNNKPFLGRMFGKRDGEWAKRYRNEELGKHDVAIKQILRSEKPFSWNDVRSSAVTDEEKNLFVQAAKYGLKDGWLVPYYGAGGGIGFIGFYGDCICDKPETQHLLSYAGQVFYRFARENMPGLESNMAEIKLSKRQREVLYWISHGKTNWEMARLMELAPSTVDKHAEAAKAKLGVNNRTEAASLAARYRLLDDYS